MSRIELLPENHTSVAWNALTLSFVLAGVSPPTLEVYERGDADYEDKLREYSPFLRSNDAIRSKGAYHIHEVLNNPTEVPETVLIVCAAEVSRNNDTEQQHGGPIAAVMLVREMNGYRIAGCTAPLYRRLGIMTHILQAIRTPSNNYSTRDGNLNLFGWVHRSNLAGMALLAAAGYSPTQLSSVAALWTKLRAEQL